uniref:beta-N-acetylhexosaminidase n=1 Tax=Phallusia mammillata TaxID=59560 RepID=A0A6F9DDX1_9ASCI|nr:putative beta-hexosaminidase [Phallusia mammillata]
MRFSLQPRRIFGSFLVVSFCTVVFLHTKTFWRHMMADFKEKKACGELLDYIAENLVIRYTVLSNTGWVKNQHEIILTNNGDRTISQGQWSIYFNHMYLPEGDHFRFRRSYPIPGSQFVLTHLDGTFLKLSPQSSFKGIAPETAVIVRINSPAIAARCYVLPRWYVAAPNCRPRIIRVTDDEKLEFVSDFNHPSQWKRGDNDNSDPFTPAHRLTNYNILDKGESPLRIIPKPISSIISSEETVDLSSGKWNLCNSPPEFSAEIKKFGEVFGLSVLPEKEPCPPTHAIQFIHEQIPDIPLSDEAYSLTIEGVKPSITVRATHPDGVFYALQTLKSLATTDKGTIGHVLPAAVIKDAPRFGYRGLHLDAARNFLPVDDVIGILEAMAMYKLNKLHLHLTDDEAWRLEIPDLPELTQVGSRRCHTEDESECLFPALGSGPFDTAPGSGYYSREDYIKLLQAAVENHIELIPEIDMPGHSHAAIKSMEARYYRFMKTRDEAKATEYLLSDFDDASPAMSVQHFRNNAMNPCMPSTYRFVEKILDTLIDLHSEIQPIRTFHVGGDEVAKNSWRDSPVCRKFIDETDGFPYQNQDLQEHFIREVSKILSRKNDITMGVWEDGALQMPQNEPFNKRTLNNVDVLAYAWNNANWNSKSAARTHLLANAGYKVIVSSATHFYFDHPQEPDPEEIGLFWATRYSDDKNVFGFVPDDLFANAKIGGGSVPFTDEEHDRIRYQHAKLERPENVVGMQAQLWSEMVRDVAVAHSQLFPRLIAFAERAWHRAEWEQDDTRKMRYLKYQDWSEFANVVGYKEFPRLKAKGIKYRIPPPGVRIHKLTLEIGGLYPGLTYKMRSFDDDTGKVSDWTECFNGQPMEAGDEDRGFEFMATDGQRTSRIIKYNMDSSFG